MHRRRNDVILTSYARWATSIFRGLSVYGINLNNADRIEDGLVVFDEVSFDEVSCTGF